MSVGCRLFRRAKHHQAIAARARFDQYLLAEGETRLVFFRSLLRAGVLYLAVPIGHALGGTVGAILGVSMAYLAVIPLVLHLQAKRGLLDWRQELRTLTLLAPAGSDSLPEAASEVSSSSGMEDHKK